MHYSVFMEDYLEFEDWRDQENEDVNFNDSSSEERLMGKLNSGDHYFRKQGLTELFTFLQQNTNLDVFPSIFDSVKKFSSDNEPSLRSDFADSLMAITKIGMTKTLIGWNCIADFTIPSAIGLLHDTNKQIRLTSHSTIIFLIQNNLLDKDLFLKEIYPTLEEMMVSYNPDELRTECFTLLVQISQILDNCLEEQLLRFCRDFISTNDNLRKTCASYLLIIINGSSDNYLNDWLEIFYKLSDDNSWYVKKFCIECAVSLSKRVTAEERWTKMANVYYNFMTDSKKWVIICAYQNFGAFIATFAVPSKSHCDISAQGNVVTMQSPSSADHPSVPTSVDNRSDSESDSNFGSVVYWQQPINSTSAAQVSPVILFPFQEIDLNQSDSSDNSAYNWPPDLSKYKQEIVPPKLLQCYSNIIHEVCDTDLIRPCAFSMPAVLVTLGPSCWPYLKGPYIKLIQFMSWKVRLSLAASLHHVFQIFRYNDSAIDDLLSTYKELIKDVDEVKCGLMSHISDFYLALPIDRYPMIFEDFDDLVHLDNLKNWRYRVTCMEQLQILITNIEIKSESDRTIFIQIFKTRWLAVIFNFSEEDVWAVRSAATNTMIATLKRLAALKCDQNNTTETTDYDIVIKQIEDKIIEYSVSDTWFLRQQFLQIAVRIVTTEVVSVATIDSLIMPKYLNLCCGDSVPNNRMVGGQGLVQICSHGYFVSTSTDIRKMIDDVYQQLKGDKDRDVRDSVDALRTLFATDLS